jgi:hypothetical protein
MTSRPTHVATQAARLAAIYWTLRGQDIQCLLAVVGRQHSCSRGESLGGAQDCRTVPGSLQEVPCSMRRTHVRRSEQNVLDYTGSTGQSPLHQNMQSCLLLYQWQP